MTWPQLRRSAIATAAIGLAALALTSCGPSAANREAQSNEEALRTIVANDRQQIEALQQQVARENDRISELEHNGADSSGNTLAALEARLNKLEGQGPAAQVPPIGSPAPATATTPAANGSSEAAASPAAPASDAAAEASPETAPEAAPTTIVTAAPRVPPPPPPAAPAPAAGTPAPTWQAAASTELAGVQKDTAAKLYRAGLAAMKAGNYQAAATKFDEMQHRYPKSELSGSAEYFAGNARYELGQYEKAILQFNDLGSRFPEGRFTSAAMLREAQAFAKINDPIDARLTLQKLLNEHPSAPEGPSAKAMLDSLSS